MIVLAIVAVGCGESDLARHDKPLIPAPDATELVIIDPRAPIQIDPPAEGWFHLKFKLRRPMQVSQVNRHGQPALRCATDAGGSIFGRYTDFEIARLPMLRWAWEVEKPIVTAIDEGSIAGDDHAARLFLRFTDSENQDHAMEIIWSTKRFQPGSYKTILGFPHYVAHSGDQDVGRWINEEVDLREMYKQASGREDSARLTLLALFCDTDDTFASSIAHFGAIRAVGSGQR